MPLKTTLDLTVYGILKALGLTSSTTLISLFIGLLTSKVLAVEVGPEGVGVLGVFRTVSSLLMGLLSAGYTTVLIQQVAQSKNSKERSFAVTSALGLFLLQAAFAIALVTFFSSEITELCRGILGDRFVDGIVQILLAMTTVNIGSQILYSILRGKAELKHLGLLQILTSLSGLILIFPLAKMGILGLALSIGSGSVLSLPVALFFVWKAENGGVSFSEVWAALGRVLKSWRLMSLVTFQSGISIGALLVIQRVIAKHLGLSSLGNYNAAMFVLDSSVLLIFSGIRSHLLPSLSQLENTDDKAAFFQRWLKLIVSIVICGTLLIAALAPLIVHLFFSAEFEGAVRVLRILSLSLVGLTVVSMYNTLLIHYEKHLVYVVIDSLSSVLFVVGVYISVHFSHSLPKIGWLFFSVSFVAALIYVLTVTKLYGSRFFPLLGSEVVDMKNAQWNIFSVRHH